MYMDTQENHTFILSLSPCLAVLIIDLLLNGDQDDNESYGGGTGYGAPTTGYEQPSTGYGVQDSYGAAPAPQSYAAAPAPSYRAFIPPTGERREKFEDAPDRVDNDRYDNRIDTGYSAKYGVFE